ncbi:hypothetical protein THASP1DRAFT_29515 [Thamnocephalis sphaerospora]|uniref:Uncharacterized protein n=1 Tax=Thamnocephalis sphaerospora TaxID=78915 RepID=A0A4P9XTC7_9FUNG|nr:hypothetical protein THASP1DRAFT_29515 [Thamnocephalis sphaerospora]|eukprot:RKP08680.1 hypothetical protein THASP1DRAFT_29515 [Thamnocephalis sphaerospora]
MLKLFDSPAEVLLQEQWQCSLKVQEIWPIVSRELLLVQDWDDALALLSLHDGTVVHHTLLGCWVDSGLYPPEERLKKTPKYATWSNPQEDATLHISADFGRAVSSNVLFYSKSGSHTVIDYTACLRQRV